ncbi:MAG: MFS transporter [Spirochaetia bacterium]|nr:MFS transporter [Spirochaetia bacterium]
MDKIKKSILQACLFQGWHWFIVGLIIPILALFQLERGLSLIQIGLNMAMYGGTVIILEIPSGILADFVGQKKVYVLSVFINSLTMLILMLTTETVWIFLAFILMGAGRAFASGSLESIFLNKISASENNKDMDKLISYTQFAIPVGLALGALLGGFLPDLHITKILLLPLSDFYALNFFIAMLFNIVIAGLFILYVSDSQENSALPLSSSTNLDITKKSDSIVALAIRTIKNSPIFFIIMLTTLAWGFAFSGLETFWQPRVFQITRGTGSIFIYGLLTNGYFLAGALGSLISWPLCKLLGNKPFIFLFSQRTILGAMFFVLSGITGLGWFSAVYIVLFLFNGISSPVEMSVLNREIPSESRATLLSVISFILQAGGLTGALIGGFLSEVKGIGFTWKIGAVILIISSILYLWIYKKSKAVTGATDEF